MLIPLRNIQKGIYNINSKRKLDISTATVWLTCQWSNPVNNNKPVMIEVIPYGYDDTCDTTGARNKDCVRDRLCILVCYIEMGAGE
jgi:hypothetical protein